MKLKNHLIDSIEKGYNLTSKLTTEVLRLPGYSGLKVKHFLNSLLSDNSLNYLEVGVFKGSTFCSALYKNTNKAYAIDNWSEFGIKRDNFISNSKKYLDLNNITVIEEDCFKVDLDLFKNKIDVFFYDGNHSYDAHLKALDYFYPVMKQKFIYIVDDYNWTDVRNGTLDSFYNLTIKTLFDKEIFTKEKDNNPLDTYGEGFGWWNGLGIFLIDKGK
jgi:hypothetical protein